MDLPGWHPSQEAALCLLNMPGYLKPGMIEIRVLMVFVPENENLDYAALHQGYCLFKNSLRQLDKTLILINYSA